MAEQIIVFDTTLRDGEQAPGINLNAKAKVEIAEQLARLGVDVIEAGFPQASPGDFEAVKAVAERVKGATVAALARTAPGDVDRAAERRYARFGRYAGLAMWVELTRRWHEPDGAT